MSIVRGGPSATEAVRLKTRHCLKCRTTFYNTDQTKLLKCKKCDTYLSTGFLPQKPRNRAGTGTGVYSGYTGSYGYPGAGYTVIHNTPLTANGQRYKPNKGKVTYIRAGGYWKGKKRPDNFEVFNEGFQVRIASGTVS